MAKYKPWIVTPIALLLLAWPVFVDQADLACKLSPSGCTDGYPLASALKFASLILGGLAVGFFMITPKVNPNRAWMPRIFVSAVIALAAFIVTYLADFQRDFHF